MIGREAQLIAGARPLGDGCCAARVLRREARKVVDVAFMDVDVLKGATGKHHHSSRRHAGTAHEDVAVLPVLALERLRHQVAVRRGEGRGRTAGGRAVELPPATQRGAGGAGRAQARDGEDGAACLGGDELPGCGVQRHRRGGGLFDAAHTLLLHLAVLDVEERGRNRNAHLLLGGFRVHKLEPGVMPVSLAIDLHRVPQVASSLRL
mmetsp:Transcript_110658/g.263844  ORF Transcript_110658/g.263844 Transcript_110658/m.263844 type:complete len:207 (-) Transcript_110658:955-1575(-)